MKIFILLICLFFPSYAWAVSDNIKEMCIDDYLTFCNQFDLGTPELTTCMRDAVDQLSEGCRNALKSEGFKKQPETVQEDTKINEGGTMSKEVSKVTIPAEKNIIKTVKKSKKSASLKSASLSNKSKTTTSKSNTVIVSYPKWLQIPRSVGSSISVYGAN